ncbi:DNase I-like protein [Dioscorea alata]|uniref:DNase I-like protein n=1 Tax=Dioscorea alata TaxID=55571 RepID=A0ACB7WMG8_DIOAL|nr:DNase I-like protein [Dioscorea alata]
MNLNIITWNVRGLGRPNKRFLVKNFFDLHQADVCCIQESKLAYLTQSIWREIGEGRLNSFNHIPARGSSGGIIIGWNSSTRKGRVVFSGSFCLTVEFTNLVDNSVWWCTSVYGPNLSHLKQSFWDEISAFGTDHP